MWAALPPEFVGEEPTENQEGFEEEFEEDMDGGGDPLPGPQEGAASNEIQGSLRSALAKNAERAGRDDGGPAGDAGDRSQACVRMGSM